MKRRDQKALELAAYQFRQGMAGILEACRCGYPLELADTPTEHALDCPAHLYIIAYRGRYERNAKLPEKERIGARFPPATLTLTERRECMRCGIATYVPAGQVLFICKHCNNRQSLLVCGSCELPIDREGECKCPTQGETPP